MNIQAANRLTPYMFHGTCCDRSWSSRCSTPAGTWSGASFPDWNPSQRIGEPSLSAFKNYVTLELEPAFRESLSVTFVLRSIVVSVEMVIGRRPGAAARPQHARHVGAAHAVHPADDDRAVVVGLMWRYMYHPTGGHV
jgi:multiple sugar transport system permease protein